MPPLPRIANLRRFIGVAPDSVDPLALGSSFPTSHPRALSDDSVRFDVNSPLTAPHITPSRGFKPLPTGILPPLLIRATSDRIFRNCLGHCSHWKVNFPHPAEIRGPKNSARPPYSCNKQCLCDALIQRPCTEAFPSHS